MLSIKAYVIVLSDSNLMVRSVYLYPSQLKAFINDCISGTMTWYCLLGNTCTDLDTS